MNRRDVEEWELLLGITVPKVTEEIGSFKIARQRGWMPRIDLLEAPAHVLIRVELAGVPGHLITLSHNADRNSLLIKGNRPDELGALPERYQPHLLEIEEGGFAREVTLPADNLDIAAVKTQLKNGILSIILPKKPTTTQVIVVEHIKVNKF